MNQKDKVYEVLFQSQAERTAKEIATILEMDRSNVSRYLNEWYKEGRIKKTNGRPVKYYIDTVATVKNERGEGDAFSHLIGVDESLSVPVQKAKAAILYPPKGLHTIIYGETGTGKSLFAECMYHFAHESNVLADNAPFVSFNCADYAQNPQLLFGHIFGVKKGAFTGADHDQQGLVAQADGGILFLDEIHRLPPEGQEMLFTFIDKGVYRPLGESHEVKTAQVQIIGATTEDASTFLTTFNRRIPMTIHLPSLNQRTIEERYDIVTTFFMEEARRLHRNLSVERDVLLAFMLYHAEANIGQVKRDVKLVCAKSFLQYQRHPQELMKVRQCDLPITVQKGLLNTKNHPKLMRLFDHSLYALLFNIETKEMEWSKVATNEFDVNMPFSLEATEDFNQYVTQLHAHYDQEKVDSKVLQLTNAMYDLAVQRLEKNFDAYARQALAVHLETMLERLKNNEVIQNKQLNYIRKRHLKEFQLAMELSLMIEKEYNVLVPMEEIGYLTLFLTLDPHQEEVVETHPVQVIVLMHGKHTASEMLATAQELLNTSLGMAMNMPLSKDVSSIYDQLKNYVVSHTDQCTQGILLLTDMGSLNRFSEMLMSETGVKCENIPLTSTLIVMESLRLASLGRTLEDIYYHIQSSLSTLLLPTLPRKNLPQAIVVTCFTGEGVATKMTERLKELLNNKEMKIITMQFIEEQSFCRHIDELLSQYDIKAIVGTVEVHYHNIPYFRATDLFNEDTSDSFQRMLETPLSIEEMSEALADTLVHLPSIKETLILLRDEVRAMQQSLALFVGANVESGMIMHLAFLVDHLLQKGDTSQRHFDHIDQFKKENKLAYDTVATQLLELSKKYHIQLSEDEIAYVTQMLVNNRVESPYITR